MQQKLKETIFLVEDPRVRLNLGCGQRLMQGFINVDIVTPANLDDVVEETNFKQADVRKLSEHFEAEFADEIHAYHVFEHFSFPEAIKALSEWRKVLKPGGILVLELPDVTKCAINLLQAVTSNEKGLVMNMGLLGFYGEQDEERPFMQHKFGYWPAFLREVLENNGFEGTVVCEPKTKPHTRDLRDMRVEALKSKDD